jgi:osmotically-inducible protein OsmY
VSSNVQLEQEVRMALERDPRILNPADIAVSERSGAIILRGTVRGFKQRRAAVEDAGRAAGARNVVDELEVRLLEDDPRDDALRGLVLQRLTHDEAVPADFIDVKVQDGWVTLVGQVRYQAEADAAFENVVSTEGVGGVTNKIQVVSAGGE